MQNNRLLSVNDENLKEAMEYFKNGGAFEGPVYTLLIRDYGPSEVKINDESRKESAEYLTSLDHPRSAPTIF